MAGTGNARGLLNYFKKPSLTILSAVWRRASFQFRHAGLESQFGQGIERQGRQATIDELKKQNEQYPNDIGETIFLAAVYNKTQKIRRSHEFCSNGALEVALKNSNCILSWAHLI